MKIYIINNTFHYEMENLTRVFFPNEKIEIIKIPSVVIYFLIYENSGRIAVRIIFILMESQIATILT